jgi:arginine deiminase
VRNFARAEWDTLQEAVVHRPGIEVFCGLLEPYSFLFERAFSMDRAVREHMALESVLKGEGVEVHRLKRLAIGEGKKNREFHEWAKGVAKRVVKFTGPRGHAETARREFERNLDILDPETVFNIVILRPSVSLEEKGGVRVVFPRVTLDVPLANLFFMRDQQVATDTGIVVSRMSKPQRRDEPEISGTVLETAGVKIAARVKAPGTFEGGDFIPAGEFAMIGLGDRTNRSGVRQVMARGVGFDEVAVVHQPAHPLIPGNQRDPMVNMHLDTYLNIAGEGVAVGCLPLLKRAHVETYRRTSRGAYERAGGEKTLDAYLKSKRFDVVPITTLEQMCYASNFLCIRDHKIVAVEVQSVASKVVRTLEHKANERPARYGRLLEQAKSDALELGASSAYFPRKKEFRESGVEAVPVQLEEITGGYGGAHCMTCTISRRET